MEIKQIKLGNQIIDYQLQIKPIKRCYLKIKSGQVIISTSPAFSKATIEKLIRDNQDIILQQINSYIPKYNYVDGGYVYIFNQKYALVLKNMGQRKIGIHDKQIFVYHQNIQAVIEQQLKLILLDYLTRRIKEYLVSDFDLVMPQIEIKKLKSRWGACFSRQNKVSFNLTLVHLDQRLIDYVIVHELCHFMQPNHSKYFYFEVQKRLPNYRNLELKLKEVGI